MPDLVSNLLINQPSRQKSPKPARSQSNHDDRPYSEFTIESIMVCLIIAYTRNLSYREPGSILVSHLYRSVSSYIKQYPPFIDSAIDIEIILVQDL